LTDNKKSLEIRMKGLERNLAEKTETLQKMQADNVKYQRQQGTKEDIYRLQREIQEIKSQIR
jgi:hypothetical protein